MKLLIYILALLFSTNTFAVAYSPVQYIYVQSWASELPDDVYIDEFGSMKVVEHCDENSNALTSKLKYKESFQELNAVVFEVYKQIREQELERQLQFIKSHTEEICPHCASYTLVVNGEHFLEKAVANHQTDSALTAKLVQVISSAIKSSGYKGCKKVNK